MSEKTRKFLKLAIVMAGMVILQWLVTSCESDPDHTYLLCDVVAPTDNITGADDVAGPERDVVLVDFDDDLSHEEIVRISHHLGVALAPHDSEPLLDRNLYLGEVPEGHVSKVRAYLMRHYGDDVQAVGEEHYVHAMTWEPNDPLRQFQWHFDQIELGEAWTLSTGRGSVVAVIDSGIALDSDAKRNPVLDLSRTRHVPGWDFVDDSDFNWDGAGHGTHVAGTIAQSTDNKYGGVGVAYDAALMNVRVLDTSGRGYTSDVVAGIYFAADNGAHVINMSLGSDEPSDVEQEAITYAYRQGVTVVAAAGNAGKRHPSYPAAMDHVISVAATQYDHHPAPYSQWGPKVDLAAPGGNIKLDQNKDGKPDGVLQETIKSGNPEEHVFALYQGTSMAAPHVAGVAALINQWGVTHPDRVEMYLKKGADTSLKQDSDNSEESFFALSADDDKPNAYPDREFHERYGAGIVQADSAVTAAILEPGLIRLLCAIALAALMFVLSRQQSLLEADTKLLAVFLTSAAWAGSGLFFLPFVMPHMEIETVAFVIQVLSTPILGLDWVLMGVTQTPLASAALPLLILLVTHHMNTLKYWGAGITVGMTAYLACEMVLLTSSLFWLPGGDWGARVFYFLNIALVLVVTFFSLSSNLSSPPRKEER